MSCPARNQGMDPFGSFATKSRRIWWRYRRDGAFSHQTGTSMTQDLMHNQHDGASEEKPRKSSHNKAKSYSINSAYTNKIKSLDRMLCVGGSRRASWCLCLLVTLITLASSCWPLAHTMKIGENEDRLRTFNFPPSNRKPTNIETNATTVAPVLPTITITMAPIVEAKNQTQNETRLGSIQQVASTNRIVVDKGDVVHSKLNDALETTALVPKLSQALDPMMTAASKKKKKSMKKSKKMEKKHKEWKKGKKHKKKKYESKKKKGGSSKKKKGKKEKKKWGMEKKGHKKKGNFKKKKWGSKKKMKKGHKKGKKGHKMLKDKGHKKKGFKKVYHKEEWGKKKKWHDIKREKKWNTKQKKWKKKWHQEKGKKYKGKHMKKYHKKNKHGKKYKKEKKSKWKKHKGEKFKKGHKKKKEEYSKKKEGGKKKKMKKSKKEMKKKKKG